MIISFICGFLFSAITLAYVALRLTKPKQAETPRFTGPIGLGGGNGIDPHTAHTMRRIFADLERGRA
jgi:hypothetical protein